MSPLILVVITVLWGVLILPSGMASIATVMSYANLGVAVKNPTWWQHAIGLSFLLSSLLFPVVAIISQIAAWVLFALDQPYVLTVALLPLVNVIVFVISCGLFFGVATRDNNLPLTNPMASVDKSLWDVLFTKEVPDSELVKAVSQLFSISPEFILVDRSEHWEKCTEQTLIVCEVENRKVGEFPVIIVFHILKEYLWIYTPPEAIPFICRELKCRALIDAPADKMTRIDMMNEITVTGESRLVILNYDMWCENIYEIEAYVE